MVETEDCLKKYWLNEDAASLASNSNHYRPQWIIIGSVKMNYRCTPPNYSMYITHQLQHGTV